ncbi:hypothetical protein [Streptomyces sp. NBC_00271]|uniref:hypothetical protein n=1 Tax=Streptomyces sp. NBC_00271 TaxID=2975697 RepID=UPI002E29C391|nr:hypothetical protein [Streptomyces sp. NBC_00271]
MALERSSKVAVAKFASPAEPAPEAVTVTNAEISEAEQLIAGMTRDDLVGDEFTDRYTEAAEQMLDAKREHREPPRAPAEPTETGRVVDLMVALQESVRKAQAARGEDSRDEVHEMPESNPKKTMAAKKPSRRQRGG